MSDKILKTPFQNFDVLEQNDSKLKLDKFNVIMQTLTSKENVSKPFKNFDSVKKGNDDKLTIDDLETELQAEETVERLSLEDIDTELYAEETFERISLDDLETDLQAEEEEEKLTLNDLDSEIHADEKVEDITMADTSEDDLDELLDDELDTMQDNDKENTEQQEDAEQSSNDILDDEKEKLLDEELDYEAVSNKKKKETDSDGDEQDLPDADKGTNEDQSEIEDEVIIKDWQKKDQATLKDVLLYMDQLFSHLPETVIKEFARSEYYDKYNNVFDKLGI